MATAGRILIMPKGAYNASTTYEMLDMVSHNGTSWLAKKTSVGITPSASTSEYWHEMCNMGVFEELNNKVKSIPEIQTLTYTSGLVNVGTTDATIGKVFTASKNCYVMATVTQLYKGGEPTKTRLRAVKTNGDYKYQDADGVSSATLVCELEPGESLNLVATVKAAGQNEFLGRIVVIEEL